MKGLSLKIINQKIETTNGNVQRMRLAIWALTFGYAVVMCILIAYFQTLS